ncbi:CNNM domain-containing protein [Pseudoalteromonas sp. T1lg22]|uniref:CNNM domain-containing protein n=1 Tax=Pseudoalteromonas sp. T1lg22 TaxID=2077096 RepID=UPI000CF72733|nr:CNNM domain-containing protein [Pseudoalteromonas sp. T1lg22]
MLLLIAFAVLSIAVSFMCSILEAALLSITPSYIAKQKLENPGRYQALKNLKERIDQPLAAILTLNTVAHTVGAAGVGAQVTVVFGNGYLGIASAVMTILILVLSEIIPKTIGALFWRQLAVVLPPILAFLIWILKPFIWISDKITRLLGGSASEEDLRSEIKALSSLGTELGSVDETEHRAISNILDLHTIKVREVMTPRIVCETLKPDLPLDDIRDKVLKSQFTRFPILDEEEAPHGMLFKSDLIMVGDKKFAIEFARPAKVVSDNTSLEQLLTQLLEDQHHMCLVYDEYGSWQGLITMEDIIETIIGRSIVDETDQIANMRRYARRRWQKQKKAQKKSQE